jgi:hypothetical protein
MLPHNTFLHNKRQQLHPRTETNLDLIFDHFKLDVTGSEQWRLSPSLLSKRPPRQHESPAHPTNHCAHLTQAQQTLHHSIMDKIVPLILASSIKCKIHDDDPPQPHDTTPIPVWNFFSFLTTSSSTKKTHQEQIHRNAAPDQHRKIEPRMASRVIMQQSLCFPKHCATPTTQFCPKAQAAANSNNLHTVCQ